jgi:glycerate 2-kinase
LQPGKRVPNTACLCYTAKMASGTLREAAELIFRHAVSAVDPCRCVHSHLSRTNELLKAGPREYRLDDFTRILVVGAGKASAPMARAVEEILGNRITDGLVCVKYGHTDVLKRVQLREAAHPVPDEAGVIAAREMLDLMKNVDERTLVICLLSGGGSALFVSPAEGITLADKMETTKLLLASGADISAVNTVRKHLSAVKGGRFAAAAAPATLLTLVLSDVIGDPLDVIASGPTSPDPGTYADARAVLKSYGLLERVPRSVREALEKGAGGAKPETPKPGDPLFRSVQNLIVGNNRQALAAGRAKAAELGFNTMVLSSRLRGEAREIARVFAATAFEIREMNEPVAVPACVLAGGETTVTLRGSGKGGRNQEMALAFALEISGLENVLLLSGGTDGNDGPTDAAGAFAHGKTLFAGSGKGLSASDYLARNDSYHFFEPLGDLLITGPTRTNVMDIQVLLVR